MSQYSLLDNHIRICIVELEQLPTLPYVSQQRLDLRDEPDAGSNELVHMIEYNPILCSQMIRFASTPFFSPRKASNTQQAISRLGFKRSLTLALELATGKHFSAPTNGPIGLKEFWRHAVFSASLMRLPSERLENKSGIDTGLIYLSSLLHNIGYLLFAHQFPQEYKVLNQMNEDNTQVPYITIEKTRVGASQIEIGL